MINFYLITIDADVGAGEQTDAGAGEQTDVGEQMDAGKQRDGGEQRDTDAGEQRDGSEQRDAEAGEERDADGEERDVADSEEEEEVDSDEWFINFSCMMNEVEAEVETNGYHSEELNIPLVVMMKMRMLKFILNIVKVVELVNRSWN